MRSKLRPLFIFWVAACVLQVLSGCSAPKPGSESLRLRADRLIEENKTEDAIELLSEEISKRNLANPDGQDNSGDTTELRICLASAYAKQAGITIREIAKSIQLSQGVAKMNAVSAISPPSNTDENAMAFENYVLVSLKFVESFESVPKVTPENMAKLSEAIHILDSNVVKPAHGLIYAAILKIIKARSLMEMNQLMDGAFAQVRADGSCKININLAIDHLQTICSIIVSGLKDYAVASPKTADTIKKDEDTVMALSGSFGSADERSQAPVEIPSGALNQIYQLLGSGAHPVSCPAGDTTISTK